MARILYVEDNEDNIYMLKMRLENKGYETIIAKDGKEGIEKAQSEHPDLIIMDVGLPIIDGYSAVRSLKDDKNTESIPVIILTAHALSTDAEKANDAGADEFETKPVNSKSLFEKIEKLIKK